MKSASSESRRAPAPSEQLKCERLKAVAREQRGRNVEFDVTGGLAAPKHIVVHARKVVVHQRVGMNVFDRAGRDLELERIGAGGIVCRGFSRGEHEQGPYPLASA